MKSVNVIRSPRRRSKLTQAKIKDHLERIVIGTGPVRIHTVQRYTISDSILNRTMEVVFVIYDRLVRRSQYGDDMDDYREIRYAIWEDGKPQGGGIFG